MDICEVCRVNTATIHLTQISNGETLTRHLCADCAEEEGLPVLETGEDGELPPVESEPLTCPHCQVLAHVTPVSVTPKLLCASAHVANPPGQYIARSTTIGTPLVDSTFVENGALRRTLMSPLTSVSAPPFETRFRYAFSASSVNRFEAPTFVVATTGATPGWPIRKVKVTSASKSE